MIHIKKYLHLAGSLIGYGNWPQFWDFLWSGKGSETWLRAASLPSAHAACQARWFAHSGSLAPVT